MRYRHAFLAHKIFNDESNSQLPYFLSVIQVIIQLTDYLNIWLLLAIRLPDMYDNQMPTVPD